MPLFPRILLVDDDDTTNFLNQRLFQQLGFSNSLVALNGQEALNLLHTLCNQSAESPCPELILLDLNMPVMNGVQFLQAYAQQPVRLPLPVIIILTTSLNPNDMAQMQSLPIAGYLNKPLTREKISNLLHTHFGHPLAS
ncbi:response regulator [Hymenobacter koreensis]|uniref:Response regulator n=1 Tax=Hymenobacter koreensis TaxID=1084523 RepID=A0ABP8JFN9_9BACT